MMEGCPIMKKMAGRKFVPVGVHLGRYTGTMYIHSIDWLACPTLLCRLEIWVETASAKEYKQKK